MRILITGAAGFVGRHIVAWLLAAGHDVTGAVRHPTPFRQQFPKAAAIECDFNSAFSQQFWARALQNIDILINCTGILDGPQMQAIHVDYPTALFACAKQAGVQKVILISAISAREDVDTDYARSKLAGEAALRHSGNTYTILRPSLIYGETSYGGTSLLRGMAGIPVIIPVPDTAQTNFNPLHGDDLARLVERACAVDFLANQSLDVVGPEPMNLPDMLQYYRQWLGFGPARFLRLPTALFSLFGRLGDLLGRGPISSTSLAQMLAGNSGDYTLFQSQTGQSMRSMADALQDRPAGIQDRWQARLFFVAPLLRYSLALMWFVSALLGFLAGQSETAHLLNQLGVPEFINPWVWLGSCLIDLIIAGLLLVNYQPPRTAGIQFVTIIFYTVGLSLAAPSLWLGLYGPLLKNIPILVSIYINYILSEKK
ncbi:MAG: SDR family oxidoreductase [bacterium]